MKNEEVNLNEKQCSIKPYNNNFVTQNKFDICNKTPVKTVGIECPRSVSPVLNRKRKGVFHQKVEDKIKDIRKFEKHEKLYSFSLFANVDSSAQKSTCSQKSVTKNHNIQKTESNYKTSSELSTNVSKVDKKIVKNISKQLEQKDLINQESIQKLNTPFVIEKSEISKNSNYDNLNCKQIWEKNVGFKTATGKVLNASENNLQAAKILLELEEWGKSTLDQDVIFSSAAKIAETPLKSQTQKYNIKDVNLEKTDKCSKKKIEQNASLLKVNLTNTIDQEQSLLKSDISFNKNNNIGNLTSGISSYSGNLKLDNENEFCSEITDSQLIQAVDIYDDFQTIEIVNTNLNKMITPDKVSRKRKNTSPLNYCSSKLKCNLFLNNSIEVPITESCLNNNLVENNIKQNRNMLELQKLFEENHNYNYQSSNSSPMSFESSSGFQKSDTIESNKCISQTNKTNDNLRINVDVYHNLNTFAPITSLENCESSSNISYINENACDFSKNTSLNGSDLNKSNSKKKLGFRTAIGSNIKINSDSLQRAKLMFSDMEDFTEIKSTELNVSKKDFKTQNITINPKNDCLKNVMPKITEKKESVIDSNSSNIANVNCLQSGTGFTTASGTKIAIDDTALTKANNIFHDLLEIASDEKMVLSEKVVLKLNNENALNTSHCMKAGFKTALGSDIIISEKSLAKTNNIFSDLCNSPPEKSLTTIKSENTPTSKFVQPLIISKTKFETIANVLKKEEMIFTDSFDSDINDSINDKDTEVFNLNKHNESNQLKINEYLNAVDKNKNTFNIIEPVEVNKNNLNFYINLKQPKTEQISGLINENQLQRDLLKHLINVTEVRHTYLLKQEKIQREPTKKHLSYRPGLLLKKKTEKNLPRISLHEVKQYKLHYMKSNNPCSINTGSNNEQLLNMLRKIDPQNAKNIIFNFPCPPNAPVLTLPEGAFIVPSVSNTIGLCEFEMSFITMPGINVSRLPDGWFQNHFRWIVWKLASMDRQFSNCFCDQFLTPKNIMAQLKYRYDRDVHGNERSAIRKILEKDDSVSRRIVLCVAQIITLTRNTFEIEVTDGWYSIFASLDIPLQKMVEKNKIVEGTKLITHGAKILNTEEACHPLSAPSTLRLALNYNSTRRARWDCKLGFQIFEGPFSINLNSIDPGGGCIGKTTLQIIRVFPVKYLEKYPSDGKWVCRCEKTEQVRELEWQTQRCIHIEKTEILALKQLENEWKVQSKINDPIINNLLSKNSKLSNISCPKTLSDLCEFDPDYFMNTTSKSQQNLVYEYRSKIQTEHAGQLASRIAKLLENEKFTNRIVCPVISAIVVDVKTTDYLNGIPFMLDYWKPDEQVLEIFNEGSIISLSNTVPSEREPRTIQTTKHTKFTIIGRVTNSCFERHCTTIEKAIESNYSPVLSYFDTVGIIVRTNSYENKRAVWVADLDKRILQIQQHISSLYCAALNSAQVGDVVSFYNLYFTESRQVQAKWSTIMTKYPTHTYLSDALTKLQNSLPSNLENFIEECNEEINKII